jgi:hypothetical protein
MVIIYDGTGYLYGDIRYWMYNTWYIYMIGHDVLAMVYIDFELSYGMLYVIGDRKSYGVV